MDRDGERQEEKAEAGHARVPMDDGELWSELCVVRVSVAVSADA